MSPQTFNETFALMIGTKRKKEPRGGRNSEERRKYKNKIKIHRETREYATFMK